MTILPNVAEPSANVSTTLCGRGYSRRRVVSLLICPMKSVYPGVRKFLLGSPAKM